MMAASIATVMTPMMQSTRERRRAGNALVTYGVVGAFLLVIVAVAVGYAGFRAATGMDRLGQARDSIVLILDDAMAALNKGERTTQGVSTSLAATSGALMSAADAANTVAGVVGNLANSAENFEILGRSRWHPTSATCTRSQTT